MNKHYNVMLIMFLLIDDYWFVFYNNYKLKFYLQINVYNQFTYT